MAGNKPPRHHHYVSKAYLRYFACKKEKDKFFVWANHKDLDNHNSFIASINDVAAEHDYNRVQGLLDEFFWEGYYAREIETDITPTFNSLIDVCNNAHNEDVVLARTIKLSLAKIIASQLYTTRKVRNYFLDETKKMLEPRWKKARLTEFEGIDEDILKEFDEKVANFNEEIYKEYWLEFLHELLDHNIDVLMDRIWVVYKNKDSLTVPLITSDNPVNTYNSVNGSLEPKYNQIESQDTTVVFPINRELLMVLYHKHTPLPRFSSFSDKMVTLNDIEFFDRANSNQKIQCERFYFTTPTIEEVENWLNRNRKRD